MFKRIARLLQPSAATQARRAVAKGRPLRIVLGSSNIGPGGWILTNIQDLDITQAESWNNFCPRNSIDNIFSEHVLEHISECDAHTAANCMFSHMRPGGCARIAVPDGNNPDENYINAVKVNGTGAGAEDHKVLYKLNSLKDVFVKAGFTITPLEYFDEAGQFHSVDWNDENGRVIRSRRYDPRNTPTQLNYSSLIVDVVRPA